MPLHSSNINLFNSLMSYKKGAIGKGMKVFVKCL